MINKSDPREALSGFEAVAITVGIVVGAGIFRTPSLVAAVSSDGLSMLTGWAVGGVISLIGALCYAELASTYPHVGGDYHYLTRAFGKQLAFLYAWCRLAVIQTGSLALLAFVFGDYMSQILSLGAHSAAIYAAIMVVALTALNWVGMKASAVAQAWLTAIEVAGLVLVIVTGLFLAPPAPAAPPLNYGTDLGLVLIFVLLTFGGWQEAAYLSSEVRNARRRIGPILIVSIIVITALYVLANAAYLRALGMAGMAASDAVAADLMRLAFGAKGAALVSVLVACSALASANATAFTGARSLYAFGCDQPFFSFLGRWDARTSSPGNALIIQGIVTFILVLTAAVARDGVRLAVEFTAPVFWLFFLLVGIALFVLRGRDPFAHRPFPVPFYPVIPAIFCASNAYLLYASVAHIRVGTLMGIGVLLVGVAIIAFARGREREKTVQLAQDA